MSKEGGYEQLHDDDKLSNAELSSENEDEKTIFLVTPEPQTIVKTATLMPESYFRLALFVTFCCCLPLGIVGLVKAIEVRDRLADGDTRGALRASEHARRYSYLGLYVGIGTVFVYFIIGLLYGLISQQ